MHLALLLPLVLFSDAPSAVDGWREAFVRDRPAMEAEDLPRLESHLIDLRGYGRLSRAHRKRAGRSLLDLYGAGLAASRTPDRARSALGWTLVQLAEREFEGLADPELVRWAAQEVLVVASQNPIPRRAAAALLLADSKAAEVLQALKICARDEDLELRSAAFEALVGRQDEGVHRLFVQTLWHADATTPSHLLGAAEAHLRRARLPADSALVPVLESYVRERIHDESWRQASRAAAASSGLPDEQAFPLLILGLQTWKAREQTGRPVKRVQYDLAKALTQRAGLDLGPHPERWRTWWSATRGGEARPAVAVQQKTESSFFGLRPSTDRLVFVLDRSGSMSQAFPPSEPVKDEQWTRYQEAIEQMVRYLETLGPQARFNLVLFADGAGAWRRELQPADKSHLREVRAWALRRPPDGGTQLRHGVELGMGLTPAGKVDLERLEADTLVVLCDGRTDEGKNWILPVLRRVNPRARIVIHGVQIGEGGDGALELLAETTGGDWVRVKD